MPRVDPVMQEGTIRKWLKKEGDHVAKGEALALAEGEKTTFEIQAPDSGVLLRIFTQEGETSQVAAPIAVIGESGEEIPLEVGKQAEREPEVTIAAVTRRPLPREGVRASPAAKRLAEEHGLEITKLIGTGPGSRITSEDVERALGQSSVAQEVMAPGVRQPRVLSVKRLEGLRKSIAERLSYSARQAVQVAVSTEVVMDKVLSSRTSVGRDLSLTAFIVKAVAQALREFPELNSSLIDSEIRIYDEISIAIAIHTKEGLIAPVIHDADKKGLDEISSEIQRLTSLASENKFGVADLTGSTFTVSNLGAYGVDSFVPVINPPNTAILGVGRIVRKPVIIDDKIDIRSLANISLVFDHRVVDGVPAAAFLSKIKQILEGWSTST